MIEFNSIKYLQSYYIQSAPLLRVDDSFKKIIVVCNDILLRCDNNGLIIIGLCQFLLDENILDL